MYLLLHYGYELCEYYIVVYSDTVVSFIRKHARGIHNRLSANRESANRKSANWGVGEVVRHGECGPSPEALSFG